jgi:hypothetical protein
VSLSLTLLFSMKVYDDMSHVSKDAPSSNAALEYISGTDESLSLSDSSR